MLETGWNGVDPCEPPRDGDIELDQVKHRCQARGISVWGNIELKQLEQGTPEQVRTEVQKIMGRAKAAGGFVLMPTAAPINLPLCRQGLGGPARVTFPREESRASGRPLKDGRPLFYLWLVQPKR